MPAHSNVFSYIVLIFTCYVIEQHDQVKWDFMGQRYFIVFTISAESYLGESFKPCRQHTVFRSKEIFRKDVHVLEPQTFASNNILISLTTDGPHNMARKEVFENNGPCLLMLLLRGSEQ